MASAVPVYEDRSVSIGRVFQRALSAVKLNPIVILGIALIIGAVPGLMISYTMFHLGLYSPDATRAGGLTPSGFSSAMFISSLVGFTLSAIVQGALTRATVSANEGRLATFGESLSSAFRVLLPLIGLSILWALGVMVGFVLLLVPGIILLLMWAVAVPSLVIEREGVFAAFRRSAQLTEGSRWKILGLCIVLLVIYWLMSTAVAVVGLRMYSPANPGGLGLSSMIGSILVGTIFNMLWGTIQPSLYVELRQAKEGGSLENLEEVFA